MKKLASACLLMTALTLLIKPVLAEKPGTETKGTVKLELKTVHAVLQNGSPDTNPADNKACHKQVSDPKTKYLGHVVTTTYSINTKSLMMSASSTLPSPNTKLPLELVIPLNPLGIKGEYAFGSSKPAELPNTYVLFSLDKHFGNAQSSILVLNSNEKFNCLVSSNANPFKSGLKEKYKVQK
jgi:hypothetical protein